MNILHINISSFTQIHGTMNDKYMANIHIHPPGHFPANLMFPKCLLFILTLTFTVFYPTVRRVSMSMCPPAHKSMSLIRAVVNMSIGYELGAVMLSRYLVS